MNFFEGENEFPLSLSQKEASLVVFCLEGFSDPSPRKHYQRNRAKKSFFNYLLKRNILYMWLLYILATTLDWCTSTTEMIVKYLRFQLYFFSDFSQVLNNFFVSMRKCTVFAKQPSIKSLLNYIRYMEVLVA